MSFSVSVNQLVPLLFVSNSQAAVRLPHTSDRRQTQVCVRRYTGESGEGGNVAKVEKVEKMEKVKKVEKKEKEVKDEKDEKVNKKEEKEK